MADIRVDDGSAPAARTHLSSALVVAPLICAAMLVGCGPSKKEATQVSQTHESHVKATADLIVATFLTQNPDLTTRVDHLPGLQDGWSDCSDGSRPTDRVPTTIQWKSSRVVYLEELTETDSLVPPLVEVFRDDGWVHVTTTEDELGYGVMMSKDGYTMTIGGNSDADPTYLSQIGIKVVSACADAPSSILGWKPSTTDSAG